MIAANKNPFIDSLIYIYLQVSLRKNFYSIEAHGMEHFQQAGNQNNPVIAVANHSCWWDGLIIYYLTRFKRNKEFYCMMEEKQLRHYPFFTWLGVFSVDQGNSLRAAAAVRYACKLLKRADTLMWIFPQGEQTSRYEKIELKPGLEYLAKQSNSAVILPVAFAFEYFREQKPQILIRFGAAIPSVDVTTEKLQETLQELSQAVLADCRKGNFEGYERLLKPSLSVNKRWEWITFLVRGKLKEFRAEN